MISHPKCSIERKQNTENNKGVETQKTIEMDND